MIIDEYGTENSPTILCILGLFLNGQCFSQLIQQLPDCHFVCVTLDGHHPGSEDFPKLPDEIEKLTNELLDRGLDHFDLCIGLSLGTIISVSIAANRNIRIDRLLLDGAVNFYRCPVPFLEKAAMNIIFRMGIRISQKRDRTLLQIRPDGSDPWADIYPACMRVMSRQSVQNIVQVLTEFTPKPGLTMPIFCMYGSRENNVYANKRILRRCYPQAVFSIRRGCNHLEFLNRAPEDYAEIIRNLLKG